MDSLWAEFHHTIPMKRLTRIATLAALLCLPAHAADEKKAPPAEAKADAKPVVEMKTSMGTITIELDREKAPVTVENFLKYVEKKHFDGTVFHRVIATFMIQGGGFAREDGKLVEKPTGAPIKNEGGNGLKNQTGTIAMARTPDPNSATAQFFINTKDNEFLNQSVGNPGYAVFGKVTKGIDVVNQIKDVRTGQGSLVMRLPNGRTEAVPSEDVPIEAVTIESVRVVAAPAPAAPADQPAPKPEKK